MKVLVVGSGVFGLCTALSLVDHGHEVELIEQNDIPNQQSSSYDFHRLIRHAYGTQSGYALQIPGAFRAWERLWVRLGQNYYVPTGCLSIGRHRDPWISASKASHVELGIEHEIWPAAKVKKAFPWLKVYREEEFLFSPEGGILGSGSILEAVVSLLKRLGVVLHPNTPVSSVDKENGRVQTQDGATLEGDHVFLALGGGHNLVGPGDINVFRQTYALHARVPIEASVEGSCPMILDIAEGAGCYYVPGSHHFPAKFGDHIARFECERPDTRAIQPEEIESLMNVIGSRIESGFFQTPDRFGQCFYSCTTDRSLQIRTEGKSTLFFGGSGHGFKFGALFGELIADYISGACPFSDASRMISGQV